MPFCAERKQTPQNIMIRRIPYTELFGTEPKLGSRSTKIPPTVLEILSSDLDLERFRERETAKRREENQVVNLEKEMCPVCSSNLNETTYVSCS